MVKSYSHSVALDLVVGGLVSRRMQTLVLDRRWQHITVYFNFDLVIEAGYSWPSSFRTLRGNRIPNRRRKSRIQECNAPVSLEAPTGDQNSSLNSQLITWVCVLTIKDSKFAYIINARANCRLKFRSQVSYVTVFA
jgi:hypothetical protein